MLSWIEDEPDLPGFLCQNPLNALIERVRQGHELRQDGRSLPDPVRA